MPKDVLPKEVSDRDVEDITLRSFLHEFCIVPTGPTISHGFLSGIESRLRRLDGRSSLAKACKMVAYASHGIKFNQSVSTVKAEKLNHALVTSLAAGLQNRASSSKKDDALVVMLLGLYEVSSTLKWLVSWSHIDDRWLLQMMHEVVCTMHTPVASLAF